MILLKYQENIDHFRVSFQQGSKAFNLFIHRSHLIAIYLSSAFRSVTKSFSSVCSFNRDII